MEVKEHKLYQIDFEKGKGFEKLTQLIDKSIDHCSKKKNIIFFIISLSKIESGF